MKFLIVGLGNLGPQYALTRHNAGFMVLDQLAQSQRAIFQKQHLAELACYTYRGCRLYLAKPTTYMNHSGEAVRYWLRQHRVHTEHSLVVVDDLALPFGNLRMRPRGASAGHNGLRSVETELNAQVYPRLRVGVGHDFRSGQQTEYVLAPFTAQEQAILPKIIGRACQMIHTFCTKGIEQAMSQYNGPIPQNFAE